MKPLYVVFGESTRTSPQSNGAVACRGTIGSACTAEARSRDMATDENDNSILIDFKLISYVLQTIQSQQLDLRGFNDMSPLYIFLWTG
jgi:hypothetical protein